MFPNVSRVLGMLLQKLWLRLMLAMLRVIGLILALTTSDFSSFFCARFLVRILTNFLFLGSCCCCYHYYFCLILAQWGTTTLSQNSQFVRDYFQQIIHWQPRTLPVLCLIQLLRSACHLRLRSCMCMES